MGVAFLQSLEIQAERVLTSNVLGREDFIGQLRIAARAWQAHQDTRRPQEVVLEPWQYCNGGRKA